MSNIYQIHLFMNNIYQKHLFMNNVYQKHLFMNNIYQKHLFMNNICQKHSSLVLLRNTSRKNARPEAEVSLKNSQNSQENTIA